ncbi:uncharacterized protein [Diadema setosum]|uniref:uncharacterized protein n=1 Tax=Diadema setosum TaxID=31175 RepID=UPI003B3B996E
MVIHFLQSERGSGRLPVLHPLRWEWAHYPNALEKVDIRDICGLLENRVFTPGDIGQDPYFRFRQVAATSILGDTSMPSLLKDFFKFYASFDFARSAITLRSSQELFLKAGATNTMMYIQNPVRGTNAAASVQSPGNIQAIRHGLVQARDYLDRGGDWRQLLPASS